MAQEDRPTTSPSPQPARSRRWGTSWLWGATGLAGLLAIAITVVVVVANQDSDDRAPSSGTASAEFGGRHVFADSLALEVSSPRPYQQDVSVPAGSSSRLIAVKVNVTNTTRIPYELDPEFFGPAATFGGQPVERLHVPGSEVGSQAGGSESGNPSGVTIPAGGSFSYEVILAVGAMPGELRLEFQAVDGIEVATFKGDT